MGQATGLGRKQISYQLLSMLNTCGEEAMYTILFPYHFTLVYFSNSLSHLHFLLLSSNSLFQQAPPSGENIDQKGVKHPK